MFLYFHTGIELTNKELLTALWGKTKRERERKGWKGRGAEGGKEGGRDKKGFSTDAGSDCNPTRKSYGRLGTFTGSSY